MYWIRTVILLPFLWQVSEARLLPRLPGEATFMLHSVCCRGPATRGFLERYTEPEKKKMSRATMVTVNCSTSDAGKEFVLCGESAEIWMGIPWPRGPGSLWHGPRLPGVPVVVWPCPQHVHQWCWLIMEQWGPVSAGSHLKGVWSYSVAR